MKKIISLVGYFTIAVMIFSLSGCNFLTPETPSYKICTQIALGRLKHPGSYDENTRKLTKPHKDQINVTLTFTAWNDYKVPMPQSISCLFQDKKDGAVTNLLSIKWNGYPLRTIEMDDIRASLNKSGPQS